MMAELLAISVDCPVCLEEYQEPVTLSCEHSMCTRCFKRISLESALNCLGGVHCQVCKTMTPMKDECDIVIKKDLQEYMKIYKLCQFVTKDGQPCDNPAVDSCATCRKKYCQECFPIHGFGTHIRRSVAQLRAVPCEKHNLPRDILCTSCSQLICLTCAREHRETGHQPKPLADMTAELTQLITGSIPVLSAEKRAAMQELQDTQQAQVALYQNHQDMRARVLAFLEDAKLRLEDKVNQTFGLVDQDFHSRDKLLTIKQELIAMLQARYDALVEQWGIVSSKINPPSDPSTPTAPPNPNPGLAFDLYYLARAMQKAQHEYRFLKKFSGDSGMPGSFWPDTRWFDEMNAIVEQAFGVPSGDMGAWEIEDLTAPEDDTTVVSEGTDAEAEAETTACQVITLKLNARSHVSSRTHANIPTPTPTPTSAPVPMPVPVPVPVPAPGNNEQDEVNAALLATIDALNSEKAAMLAQLAEASERLNQLSINNQGQSQVQAPQPEQIAAIMQENSLLNQTAVTLSTENRQLTENMQKLENERHQLLGDCMLLRQQVTTLQSTQNPSNSTMNSGTESTDQQQQRLYTQAEMDMAMSQAMATAKAAVKSEYGEAAQMQAHGEKNQPQYAQNDPQFERRFTQADMDAALGDAMAAAKANAVAESEVFVREMIQQVEAAQEHNRKLEHQMQGLQHELNFARERLRLIDAPKPVFPPPF